MGTHTGNVITLSNSIVGVSVLAMPFCFKQCGILLAILMLLFSNIITRLACHYLMKSAMLEKRKNFEMLAFRVYGPTGKLIVELCIIGFMLGTCVAYFVIMGDLGPGIVGPAFGFQHPTALRPSVLIAVAVFVVLPLGLLKNVDSLSTICAATLAFYFCLVLKVMGEAINHLLEWDWMDKVYFWRPLGILQCIPIFSMALSCQTQLFEIFDPLPSNLLDRMNAVVRSAINMVTLFYICVGFFGYIAYCDQTFSGNLMMNFSPTVTSDVIKIGFLLSVAVSFPLVIFPCRASIYSLFFSKGYEHAQTGSAHIPESRFKCITFVIVTASLVTGLLIPNIEIVLGLVGSTIGVIICVIIPGVIFISLSMRNNNERLVAKFLVCTGLVIMTLGTYANLYATEEAVSGPERNIVPVKKNDSPALPEILKKVEIKDDTLEKIKDVDELAALPELKSKVEKVDIIDPLPSKEIFIQNKDLNVIEAPKPVEIKLVKDTKKEPPVPEEPEIIHETKKEPPVPEPPKEMKKDFSGMLVSKESRVLEDIKPEPAGPVEPSEVIKISDLSKTVRDGKEDIVAPLLNDNEVKKLAEIKGESDLTNNNGIDKAKEKEIIIEKIKEHEEAQRKLNVEKEKLLEEIKYFVNNTKDSLKLVNVKTGVVTDIKASKYQKNEFENHGNKTPNSVKEIDSLDNERNGLAIKMAKGIPLPLAVKGKLTGNKSKDVQKTKENEVINKHDTGRDLLGGGKEIREKRDLEDVVKDRSTEANVNSLITINQNSDKHLNLSVAEKSNDESLIIKQNEISNNETLSKLKTELESCNKNDSSKVEPKVAKLIVSKNKIDELIEKEKNMDQIINNGMTAVEPLINEKKVDDLIKSPSYLSNSNPVLNTSPQLLSAEVSKEGLPEMPKKRDLKSVRNDEITDSKHSK